MNSLPDLTIPELRLLPKSDLHNHCLLGGKRSDLEKFCGRKIGRFKTETGGIGDLNRWIAAELRPLFQLPGSFEHGVKAAFIQARKDGVVRLEMSIDVSFGNMFNLSPGHMVGVLKKCHQEVAPFIDFRPELGFSRNLSLRTVLTRFEPFLEFDYFRSVDMYDDEFAQPVANFRELFRFARNHGFKCKAHAGEFGSAESVREAVEVLELDAVQHGIGAADSPEVMKWLSRSGITLNVCPTSNIKLKRVRSFKSHPVKILFDNGVKVTINTDDVLAFGDGVSEQYMKLLKCGLFSINEIDILRKNGLEEM